MFSETLITTCQSRCVYIDFSEVRNIYNSGTEWVLKKTKKPIVELSKNHLFQTIRVRKSTMEK